MSTSGHTLACLPSVCFEEPELGRAEPACSTLVGNGVAMRRLRLQIERMGPHFRTVLVRGEIGIGKELVARALHARSGVAREPFVVCHASSLNEVAMAEDHEFIPGHVRLSDVGILFVDGVEDLSASAQHLLLRAVEQKGARVIVSTTRDLRRMAAAGRFRPDLYHRLAMVEIVVEPLRNRTEDIPALAMHFVKRFCAQYERRIDAIADGAVAKLQSHTWPGNVREFENALRNGVLQCEGTILEAADLSMMQIEEPNDGNASGREVPTRLQDVVEQHVVRVLRECEGNKVRAAEVLGISRSTLYRMLEGCSFQ
jgi:Response regulator containing CheY-like receiver, AAA-type ATPase, and DNA-binding domains